MEAPGLLATPEPTLTDSVKTPTASTTPFPRVVRAGGRLIFLQCDQPDKWLAATAIQREAYESFRRHEEAVNMWESVGHTHCHTFTYELGEGYFERQVEVDGTAETWFMDTRFGRKRLVFEPPTFPSHPGAVSTRAPRVKQITNHMQPKPRSVPSSIPKINAWSKPNTLVAILSTE